MEDRKGSVCEKHGEFSPTGICRWCDPEKASSSPSAIGSVPASKEPGPFGAGRGFPHIPGLCTCTACIVGNAPLYRTVYCACGAIGYASRTDAEPWPGGKYNGWFHAPAKCAPVASEGPKAKSTDALKPLDWDLL